MTVSDERCSRSASCSLRKFEDSKEVIRSRKSENDRQHQGQKKKKKVKQRSMFLLIFVQEVANLR